MFRRIDYSSLAEAPTTPQHPSLRANVTVSKFSAPIYLPTPSQSRGRDVAEAS